MEATLAEITDEEERDLRHALDVLWEKVTTEQIEQVRIRHPKIMQTCMQNRRWMLKSR